MGALVAKTTVLLLKRKHSGCLLEAFWMTKGPTHCLCVCGILGFSANLVLQTQSKPTGLGGGAVLGAAGPGRLCVKCC